MKIKKSPLLLILKSMAFMIMLALTVSLSSCSSDNDEPDEPNKEETPVNTSKYGTNFKAKDFSGTWFIEGITQEDGTVVNINRTFTVLPFDVVQTETPFENKYLGTEMWAETLQNKLMTETTNGNEYDDIVVTFTNDKGGKLSESYIVAIDFSCTHGPEQYVLVLGSINYNNKVITAIGAYGEIFESTSTISGTITMKKIK